MPFPNALFVKGPVWPGLNGYMTRQSERSVRRQGVRKIVSAGFTRHFVNEEESKHQSLSDWLSKTSIFEGKILVGNTSQK